MEERDDAFCSRFACMRDGRREPNTFSIESTLLVVLLPESDSSDSSNRLLSPTGCAAVVLLTITCAVCAVVRVWLCARVLVCE
jgi:hypothetical protein